MKTTKETILKTALKMFNEKGADNVSVDMICKECGITKGSFYHHFSSKDDIFLGYWDYVSQPVKSILEIADSKLSAKEKLREIMNLGISAAVNEMGQANMGSFWNIDIAHGNKVLSPFGFTDGTAFSEEIAGYIVNLIETAQKSGEIKSKKDPKELLTVYYAAVMGISVNWSTSGADYDVTDYLNTVFDVVFD